MAILDAVQEFAGATAQFDDITLLVLRRDTPTEAGYAETTAL
jgi:serine phosphatase RsbU (regulator of sigma subunit)